MVSWVRFPVGRRPITYFPYKQPPLAISFLRRFHILENVRTADLFHVESS